MKSINRVFSNLKKGLKNEDENDDVVNQESALHSEAHKSTPLSLKKLFTPKKRRTEVRARRKEMSNRYSSKYNPFDSNSFTSLMLGVSSSGGAASPQLTPQQQLQCAGNMANQSFIARAQQIASSPATPNFLLSTPPRSSVYAKHGQVRSPAPSPAMSYFDFMRSPTQQLYRSSDVGSGVAGAGALCNPFIAGSPQVSHPSVARSPMTAASSGRRVTKGVRKERNRILKTPQTEPANRSRRPYVHEDIQADKFSSPGFARVLRLDNVMDKRGSPVLAPRSPNLLQTPSPLTLHRQSFGDHALLSSGKKRMRLMDQTPQFFELEKLRDSALETPGSAKRRRTSISTRVVPEDDDDADQHCNADKVVPYTLRVMVVEARDLVEVDVGFKDHTNPYVVLSIDGSEQQQKTEVQSKTTSPKFNQAFVFTVMATQRYGIDNTGQSCVVHATTTKKDGKSKHLVLSVHDHDTIFDHQCIGTVHIDLDELLGECIDAERERGEHQIVRSTWTKLRGVRQGEIHLVYQLSQGVNFSI